MIKRPAATSFSVANYFIKKGRRDGIPIMKLQRLVYYAHGWFLALYDRPLIDECIEAWIFGPVVPSLYENLNQRGFERVAKLLCYFDKNGFPDDPPQIFDQDLQEFLDSVWNAYAKFPTIQLSNAAHAKGTPWDLVASEYNYVPPRNKEIPDEVIREYFIQEQEEINKEENGTVA